MNFKTLFKLNIILLAFSGLVSCERKPSSPNSLSRLHLNGKIKCVDEYWFSDSLFEKRMEIKISYAFDANGLLTVKTDSVVGKSEYKINYQYDENNNILKGSNDLSYTYDKNQHVISIKNCDADCKLTTYEYNTGGDTIKEKLSVDGNVRWLMNFKYSNDKSSKIGFMIQSGKTYKRLSYKYDNGNLIEYNIYNEDESMNVSYHFKYDKFGNMIEKRLMTKQDSVYQVVDSYKILTYDNENNWTNRLVSKYGKFKCGQKRLIKYY